jgi:hypothetical protein
MGSGGALTLWSPSNEAGAFRGFLIDVRAVFWELYVRCVSGWYRPPFRHGLHPLWGCRSVIDGGTLKHEQSY